MTKAVDKIMAGLDDARAYLNGDHAGFAVHEIEVSCPDVVAIRSKTGYRNRPLLGASAFRSARSRTGSRAAVGRRDRRACYSR